MPEEVLVITLLNEARYGIEKLVSFEGIISRNIRGKK